MWHLAGWSSDFSREPVGLMVDGHPMVFWRLNEGALAAIEDRCAHRHMPLSMGRCDGDHLQCPYHGLKFSASGRCVEVPGQDEVPPPLQVRAYPLHEKQGWVWVWAGDEPAEDVSVIPDLFAAAEDGWVAGMRRYDFAAPAELVAENLLDTSHFGYVHGEPFRPDWWIDQRPVVTDCKGGVAVDWWAIDLALPGRELIDQHSFSRFVVPGVLEMQLDDHAPGTAAAARNGGTPGPPLARNRAVIAVVPISQERSRVLVQWAIPANGADERIGALLDGLDHGFGADRHVVEAQYANQVRFGMPRSLATRSDAALLRYQRLRAKMP